jgi:regulator of RNase E activity RraA
MTSTLSSSPTTVLSTFSTCELSDALIKLGVPHGGHIPDVHAMNEQSPSQGTLCGPAYTVKMVWSGSREEKLVLEDGKHWVDTVERGSVVVVSAPTSESVRPKASSRIFDSLMNL